MAKFLQINSSLQKFGVDINSPVYKVRTLKNPACSILPAHGLIRHVQYIIINDNIKYITAHFM